WKLRSFWLKTLEPVMSEGSRSGVDWMRRNVPPTEVARARASIVLPVPGRSWRRTWPPGTRPASASRTTRSLPTMTRWMLLSTCSRSAAARRGALCIAVVAGRRLRGAGADQVGAVSVDLERGRELRDQAQDLAWQCDLGEGCDCLRDL